MIKGKVNAGKNKASSKFVLEKVESIGRDIQMEMWGDVSLSPRVNNSRLNLEMRMKFDDKYVNENSLRPLLNIKQFRDGKGPSSWYGFVFYSTLKKPKFKGSITAARGPGKSSAKKPSSKKPSKKKPSTKKTKKTLKPKKGKK